jgi:hypothetical protein
VPAAPAAVAYYLAENGQAVGPLSLQQLIERAQKGTMARDQQTWKSDTQVWVRAESLPELAAAFPAPTAMPPPPAPVAVQYFVAENGQAVGPLTLEQMVERAQGGHLATDQQVWKTDSQVWLRADSLPELQAALHPAQTGQPAAPAAPQPNAATEPQPAAATEPQPAATTEPQPAATTEPQPQTSATTEPEPVAAADDADAALRSAGMDIAVAENPDGSQERLKRTADCLVAALAPLSPEEKKQFLVDIKSGTVAADADRVEQVFPGMSAAVETAEAAHAGVRHNIDACF